VGLTGADGWQLGGFDGSGIKIAVIDAGFIGLSAAKANGDIPASAIEHDETGSGMETDTQHGTAVTEAVYDMAPGAQLYLVHIYTNSDLADAVDYCISQGVDIISISLAWYNFNHVDGVSHTASTEVYLGPSPMSSVERAAAFGILPVVAAGNYPRRHYSGYFNDDGTGRHDFGGGDTELTIYASAGTTVYGELNWNAWPTTDQDFDLELYRASDDAIVAYSRRRQRPGASGWPVPEESLSYTVPTGQSGTYYFAFVKMSASYAPHFEFLCAKHDIQDWRVASGSISNPGDAAAGLTVGVINRWNWLNGPQEIFSSLGPTNAPLIKPDIMGPDNCDSYTYGHWYGTSQATPHVAGAAALVGGRFGGFDATSIRDYLETTAVDMGDPGKDNVYGFGRVNLWPIGDLDYDGDVDFRDYAMFAASLAEPGGPASNIEADLDGDGDCDLYDLIAFTTAMSGPAG
jgi:subtilisin family serine protease